ncbi:hypothetical protein E4U43_005677 [Claviceps pusilla]|uniref:Uncharacterized protein n=1 Tax=Claviceps pusilla TaxID=123648 RepID=A0A9P7NE93_9HYPO|nr:hypothetical protein E4U43_005677 [Claviceps pusilla]
MRVSVDFELPRDQNRPSTSISVDQCVRKMAAMARSFSRRQRHTAAPAATTTTTVAATSCDGAAPALTPLIFSPFTLHHRSRSSVERPSLPSEKTCTHPRPSSQLQTVHSNVYAGDLHDTMLPGEKIRGQQQMRDGVAALVDFLKNHPPPPHNFMSIPYQDTEDDENGRGRWSKIKSMAMRSKSMPREPQQIQLPDSAVAGVTIDGHRHIAISIPWEAAPFGPEDMRSQYPVFTQNGQRGMPCQGSVRTYKNEKGTVTVLRPVTEADEAGDGSATAWKRSYSPPRTNKGCLHPPSPPSPQCRRHTSTRGRHPPPLPPHKPTRSAGSAPHDYMGPLPTSLDVPAVDDRSAPWHTSRALSRDEGSDEMQIRHKSQQTFQRSAYPARGSSMTASRSTRRRNVPPSIDGATQPQESPPNVPKVALDTVGVDSSFAALDASRCRKTLVRDKKRRDLEAMRHAKGRGDHLPQGDGQILERGEAPQLSVTPAANRSELAGTTSGSGPTLTLSNLMVVMDMQPMLDTEPEPEPEPKTPRTSETRASQASAREMKEEHSMPSMTVKQPNLPTPPTSAHGSPPQEYRASDRTSLTRRREWRAMREKEQRASEAMALAKARAQHLASGDGPYYEHGARSTHADTEALRLYEAYREQCLRDMERRLRRLERNGDMWLQALRPVLQNMDKSWATDNDHRLDDARDWASDGDTPAGGAHRTSGDAHPRSLLRSLSLSQSRLGESHNDGDWSDDVNGIDTIETLMRELAGGTERWQRTGTSGGKWVGYG